MHDDSITTKILGRIVVVTINNARQRNPLSVATLQQLESVISELFSRDDIHSVIFTGAEDVFASGANIRELTKLSPEAARQFSRFGQNVFQMIARSKQITIAAINGYCMGGALDLALACDIRVAAESAVFSHPGAKLGIITGWGGTQRLPRIIGRARALEFFATARRYSSAEALEVGLVSRVSDPVIDCAMECANAAQPVSSSS